MGEYAEMMLDGTCCSMCGEYLGGGDGWAVLCASCDDYMPVRKAETPKRQRRREQSQNALRELAKQPLNAKRLRWLKEAAGQMGMYPGVRADLAPRVLKDLEVMGLAKLYEPHNPVHKNRYVATDAGRAKLASQPQPEGQSQ